MDRLIRDLGWVALLMVISGLLGGIMSLVWPVKENSIFSLPHISLDELQVFIRDEHGVVLDARANAFYRLGHIPKALNLSRNKFKEDFEKVNQQKGDLKQRQVVVYCSEEKCEDSAIVAGKLFYLGITNLAVFSGGWEEWETAGLMKESDE